MAQPPRAAHGAVPDTAPPTRPPRGRSALILAPATADAAALLRDPRPARRWLLATGDGPPPGDLAGHVRASSLHALLRALDQIRAQCAPGDCLLLDDMQVVLRALSGHPAARLLAARLDALLACGCHLILLARGDDSARAPPPLPLPGGPDATLVLEQLGEQPVLRLVAHAPRASPLRLGLIYPATLATLLPPDPAAVDASAQQPASGWLPVSEVAARFFARYGATIGGVVWADVEAFLERPLAMPTTVTGWQRLAAEIEALSAD